MSICLVQKEGVKNTSGAEVFTNLPLKPRAVTKKTMEDLVRRSCLGISEEALKKMAFALWLSESYLGHWHGNNFYLIGESHQALERMCRQERGEPRWSMVPNRQPFDPGHARISFQDKINGWMEGHEALLRKASALTGFAGALTLLGAAVATIGTGGLFPLGATALLGLATLTQKNDEKKA